MILTCNYLNMTEVCVSTVGIGTSCGLDGPGIESLWGARFSAPFQTGPGAHPAHYTMGTGSFLGVKRRFDKQLLSTDDSN